MEEHHQVIVVGSGPAGLATAACLNKSSIPNIVLEREDCFAPLWRKYSYDRLHLHLAKQFSQLPHFPMPSSYQNYVSRKEFVQYLDDYVENFKINLRNNRRVEEAKYDDGQGKWIVKARNMSSGEVEEYTCRFLVVATGENSDAFIPKVEGLETFKGGVIHSTRYKNGEKYKNKSVLVVGSGNSGMEIALDLANYGAKTSIAVRSPMHMLSRGITSFGLALQKYVSLEWVDSMLVWISKLFYGDLRKYGIERPKEGPFAMKIKYGKYPVIDVGTYQKIKSGEVQVLPGITSIRGNEVVFNNGKSYPFDEIIFATGFNRSTNVWLKGDDYLLDNDGLPKHGFPNHWKGQNGLYSAGLGRAGIPGGGMDAQSIANDIKPQI